MLTQNASTLAGAVTAGLLKTAGAVVALGLVYPHVVSAVVHTLALRRLSP